MNLEKANKLFENYCNYLDSKIFYSLDESIIEKLLDISAFYSIRCSAIQYYSKEAISKHNLENLMQFEIKFLLSQKIDSIIEAKLIKFEFDRKEILRDA